MTEPPILHIKFAEEQGETVLQRVYRDLLEEVQRTERSMCGMNPTSDNFQVRYGILLGRKDALLEQLGKVNAALETLPPKE